MNCIVNLLKYFDETLKIEVNGSLAKQRDFLQSISLMEDKKKPDAVMRFYAAFSGEQMKQCGKHRDQVNFWLEDIDNYEASVEGLYRVLTPRNKKVEGPKVGVSMRAMASN